MSIRRAEAVSLGVAEDNSCKLCILLVYSVESRSNTASKLF